MTEEIYVNLSANIKKNMTPKFHSLLVKDVIKETEDTVSVSFEVPDSLKDDYQFLSGQYLTLKAILDEEDTRRSYSLCSAPHENEWRVAIKQVENGKFSTFANTQLKKGDTLDVMTPTGSFKLTPSNSSKSYVLFAAGSGITPILSIAKTALTQEPNCNVTLFYGNKGFNSIIFREQVEALKNKFMSNLRVIHVLSRESLGTPLLKGRIDATKTEHLFDAFLRDTSIDDVYICGPEQMILGVKEGLKSKEIPDEKVHFELFTSPSTGGAPIKPVYDGPKVESNVQIILDGDTIDLNLDSDGENILDAAQKSGADLPFACKGGVCCTCKAKIMEGSASMDVNFALEEDEVSAGYILTCQAHPTSDKLIVSFDD